MCIDQCKSVWWSLCVLFVFVYVHVCVEGVGSKYLMFLGIKFLRKKALIISKKNLLPLKLNP